MLVGYRDVVGENSHTLDSHMHVIGCHINMSGFSLGVSERIEYGEIFKIGYQGSRRGNFQGLLKMAFYIRDEG